MLVLVSQTADKSVFTVYIYNNHGQRIEKTEVSTFRLFRKLDLFFRLSNCKVYYLHEATGVIYTGSMNMPPHTELSGIRYESYEQFKKDHKQGKLNVFKR